MLSFPVLQTANLYTNEAKWRLRDDGLRGRAELHRRPRRRSRLTALPPFQDDAPQIKGKMRKVF